MGHAREQLYSSEPARWIADLTAVHNVTPLTADPLHKT